MLGPAAGKALLGGFGANAATEPPAILQHAVHVNLDLDVVAVARDALRGGEAATENTTKKDIVGAGTV